MSAMKRNLLIFAEYLSHLIIGSLMFVSLLLIGAALHGVILWVAPFLGNHGLISLMEWAEQIIIWADVVFLVWWYLYSTVRAIREFMHHE